MIQRFYCRQASGSDVININCMSKRTSVLMPLLLLLALLLGLLDYNPLQVPIVASLNVIFPPVLTRHNGYRETTITTHPSRVSKHPNKPRHSFLKRDAAPPSLLRWIPTREQQELEVTQSIKLRQEEDLKHFSLTYLAKLIQTKLAQGVPHQKKHNNNTISTKDDSFIIHNNEIITNTTTAATEFTETVKSIVKGRFIDTTCTKRGEEVLEELFWKEAPSPFQILGQDNRIKLESFLGPNSELYISKGAILAMESLLIMGMQAGVKGGASQIQQLVSHLEPIVNKGNKNTTALKDEFFWTQQQQQYATTSSWRSISRYIQQLKYERDITGGMQLLAYLLKKRTPQGAYDLLVDLGVWKRHEDIALLRSGFPTRFSDEEEMTAMEVEANSKCSDYPDVDSLLGLRQDLRHMKVYTIDSESTSEIDDGISMERCSSTDGKTTDRLWIHIADADRWAPRNSEIIKAAQRRSTTLYLPTGSVPMFPKRLSAGCMSLRAGHDSYALSLGVVLLPDGSIDTSSIVVTPSLIRVQYRLSYDDVDEMLEEGVGFNEEWELGSMLVAAKQRKAYRGQNGSTEGLMPAQIPSYSATVEHDENEEDSLGIAIEIENGYNTGVNLTATAAGLSLAQQRYLPVASQSQLIVTEMMVLAGEAIGKWAIANRTESLTTDGSTDNRVLLELPFRSQAAPDFRSRLTEIKTLNLLQQKNAGGGYCAAWFMRRFLRPVRVSAEPSAHKGMGLDCYVQWSSPIRRYSDLQVHAAVKQYLRYNRVQQLIQSGEKLHPEITSECIGVDIEQSREKLGMPVNPIDFNEGSGFARASRTVSRSSNQYWLFEYVRRRIKRQPHGQPLLAFDCTVLGCVDESRLQYSVFIHELGLEHRYVSEKGLLNPGETLLLQVSSVKPRLGLMILSLVPNSKNA